MVNAHCAGVRSRIVTELLDRARDGEEDIAVPMFILRASKRYFVRAYVVEL